MIIMKKLTEKQVYGYSIMNWEQFHGRFRTISITRSCSFCRDANDDCKDCRIDRSICDLDAYAASTIYNDLTTAETVLVDFVEDIIRALKAKYYEIE